MQKWIGCARCDWKEPVGRLVLRCPQCSVLTEFVYDRGQARVRDSENPLERYFDLLPLTRSESIRWLGDGNTRTRHAQALGRAIGLEHLWLKCEGDNPSGSTKDRAFSVVYSYMRECGIREFGMCSTGNSSTACARGAAELAPEFTVHVFCGYEFADRLSAEASENVKLYLVDGDFVTTERVAKRVCAERGILWEGGFFNPARRAGHKLAYYEAFDEMPVQPDVVLQAVSSGMGVLGLNQACLDYLGMGRLERMPRMYAVQQQSCAPMVSAWTEDAPAIAQHHIVQRPSGLAKAILRGDPSATYPLLREAIAASRGGFVDVSAADIVEARWLALTYERQDVCYASAAALAATIKLGKQGAIGPSEHVLVNLTGVDRPRTSRASSTYELLSA